jgi:hypothetical protein
VAWQTVAALTRGPVPPCQGFWLCRAPGCEVVYFGAAGDLLRDVDLHVMPGFKIVGGEGLLCYCFLHRRADLARELAETGSIQVLEAIKAQVQAGNCACEVRNPAGKCCLGEVQAAIRQLQAPTVE